MWLQNGYATINVSYISAATTTTTTTTTRPIITTFPLLQL